MTSREEELSRLRGKPRCKLFQPTELRDASGASRRAHLLDVSATGALAHIADPPETGSSVQLALGEAMRVGRVIWTEGRRFGVRFRAPLTDAQASDILNARASAVADAARRVGTLSR